MTVPLTNQTASLRANASSLVSLDIMHLLKRMDSVILKCSSKTHTGTFDNDTYRPGMTVGYQIAGVPPVTRGSKMEFDNEYEQRTLYITADTDRWYFSVTNVFNQTDDIFYLNRKLITETISAPILSALKDRIELEGAQYLKEHSPVIPAFGKTISERLIPAASFDWQTINYLQKLRKDLVFPSTYKLVLNTRDDMLLANELTHVVSNDAIVGKAITSGQPQRNVSGFQNMCSPYIGLHSNALTANQKDLAKEYHLFFTEVPTSDQTTEGKLKYVDGTANGTGDVNIVLRAGDIIYHIANGETSGDTVNTNGLHWIQNTVKRSIPDSRYAFCVTSDAYIKQFKTLIGTSPTDTSWKMFNYEDIKYQIGVGTDLAKIVYKQNDGSTATDGTGIKLTFSHRPISDGYHQNCSRNIELDGSATPDRFLVYPNHFKNFAVHSEYFKFKCFKLPSLSGTEHSEVNDSNTGIKMLVTKDRLLQDRQNVFDVSALPCFGAVSQNLFTLPAGEGLASIETVSLIGKKKK